LIIAIEDFFTIPNIDNVYRIDYLKIWRDKYYEYYEILDQLYENSVLRKTDLCLDKYNQPLTIPLFQDLNYEETFLHLFSNINATITFYEVEKNEFECKLQEYYNLNLNLKESQSWLRQYMTFMPYYKDLLNAYLNYENSYHLRLYVKDMKNSWLYVSRHDFENILSLSKLLKKEKLLPTTYIKNS